VRTEGDWPGWLRFFLAGVEETAREAVGRAGRLLDLHEELRLRVRQKPSAAALLDHLFANPYVTIPRAAKLLGVSYPTARNAVLTLCQEGVLEETGGRSWGRLFVSRPILETVEGRG
jgi:Fic family protein